MRLSVSQHLLSRSTAIVDAVGPLARTRSRRRATWFVADDARRLPPSPEAVLCPEEAHRDAIEGDRPELIGRVWVPPATDVEAWAARLVARHRPPPLARPARVGVIGYNLKFFTPIATHLTRTPNVDVRVDAWPKFEVHNAASTNDVVDWADVVVAEWCGPNAVIAAKRKRPDQRLVVRLHRFELEREHWRDVDIDAVDAVVTVGPHYRDLVLDRTGWPADKVTVIPNAVDDMQLDRPKRPGADRVVGLLGAIPWRKRPDRALDLVVAANAGGGDYRLSIKGDRPEQHRWIWDDADHRRRFEALAERIAADADLVTWHPPGPDVAGWFRGVGTILSTSEDESFHLAPAEGMASGTLPIVWRWPGADAVYDDAWLVSSVDEARRRLATDAEHRADLAAAARSQVTAAYGLDAVLQRWRRLLFPDG